MEVLEQEMSHKAGMGNKHTLVEMFLQFPIIKRVMGKRLTLHMGNNLSNNNRNTVLNRVEVLILLLRMEHNNIMRMGINNSRNNNNSSNSIPFNTGNMGHMGNLCSKVCLRNMVRRHMVQHHILPHRIHNTVNLINTVSSLPGCRSNNKE